MMLEGLTGITKSSYTGDDLISRQAAIDECDKQYPNIDRQDFKAVINAVPSAEPKTGWIPVSERLPDIGDTYLVTVMVGKEIRTDVADSFGSYIDGFWDTFNDWIEDEECHVIAWMPLPKPWKGAER